MAVMEEVHNQMTEITSKQKDKIDDLSAEIRKLKAMIVKHESRIRTLESKNRELELAAATQGNHNNGNNNNSAGDDLDPDEVWRDQKKYNFSSQQIIKVAAETNQPTLFTHFDFDKREFFSKVAAFFIPKPSENPILKTG